MKRKFFGPLLVAALISGTTAQLSGIDTSDTRMLSQPAVQHDFK